MEKTSDRQPFFARFLEQQEMTRAATQKYPSDSDEGMTLKFPSDRDEIDW
jgi:hypothetical protein